MNNEVHVVEGNNQALEQFPRPSFLVVGLGNPILGDDGVGWQVAEQVLHQVSKDLEGFDTQLAESNRNIFQNLEVDCLSLGGLALMERIIGYERVIIIDAISTGKFTRGSVQSFQLSELQNIAAGHLGSAHDTSLQNAIEVGRLMGAKITEDITIVGIETDPTFDFSEELSDDLNGSIPIAVNKVMELLK